MLKMKKNIALSTKLSTILASGVVCAILMSTVPSSSAVATETFTPVMGDSQVVKVTMGKAEIVRLPGEVADLMVADPKIVDVSALQSDKLYLVGASLGDTNIIALDAEGNVLRKFDVHVRIDTVSIDNIIHEVFPNEKGVSVHTVGNQVALTGTVSTPAAAQKIAKLVAAHMGEIRGGSSSNVDSMIENLMEVRGEQQVTLRVRILEVSRDVLKELGLETSGNHLNTAGASVFGRSPYSSLNGLQGGVDINTQTGLTEDPFSIASLIFDTGINGLGDIQLLLNALEADNLANVLAEPNLTAVSGEQAGFLAGGEFPVPAGRDQQGNVTITYKQFGVSLNFKPVVMSEDRISLQMNTEVSSLDQGNSLTLADVQIPGLEVRRASTTVEINSGGSIMMAGLLKSENTKGLSGIPGIRDTPVLGDLVSSKSFQRQETEMVVIVTPYLVQPFADQTQAKAVFENSQSSAMPPMPPTTAMAPGDKGKPKALYTNEQVKDLVQEMEGPGPIVPLDTSPMTKVFSSNMRKIYGDRVKNIPKGKQAFGYMID